ncbi:MAG: Wzz/FepE/Etk N-terminal domain-containing protein [Pseudonocardia sp.]
MSPLQVQLDRVRRRKWLIVVITAIAVVGSVAFSLLSPTTYTGTATLIVSSGNRAEEDAVLAQGYVEYVNEDSAQEALLQAANLSDVDFEARTGASSPIIYIDATAENAQLAGTAATTIARTFREQVNAGVQGGADSTIAALRTQLEAAQTALGATLTNDPQRTALSAQISSLQDEILQVQREAIGNQLKDLQLTPAVTSSSPDPVVNGILALFGGLILGVAAALALAGAEDRIASPQEIRQRLGLDTLAVVSGGRSDTSTTQRAEQLKGLANVVSLSDMSQPATLAVTAVRSAKLSAQVAEGVAFYRAQQGQRTLLIRADLDPGRHHPGYPGRPGLGEFLAGRPGMRLQPIVVRDALSGMLVLPAGTARDDPYSLFAPDRFVDVVEQAGRLADLVVIDAPPVIEAAEAQVICASADRTILVLEEGVTKGTDAVEARERLERVHVQLLGAVLGRSAEGTSLPRPAGSRPSTSARPPANGTPTQAVPAVAPDEVDARA